jgi:hypothetical protein
MKYVVEMGSDGMIYIQRFHKDWFMRSEVDGRRGVRHRQQGDPISLLLFFLNKECMQRNNTSRD